jgi:hypothetical protein
MAEPEFDQEDFAEAAEELAQGHVEAAISALVGGAVGTYLGPVAGSAARGATKSGLARLAVLSATRRLKAEEARLVAVDEKAAFIRQCLIDALEEYDAVWRSADTEVQKLLLKGIRDLGSRQRKIFHRLLQQSDQTVSAVDDLHANVQELIRLHNAASSKQQGTQEALADLAQFSVRQLQANVVEPILRSLSYEAVKDVSDAHGLRCQLVAVRPLDFGRTELHLIVIEKADVRKDEPRALSSLLKRLARIAEQKVADPRSSTSVEPDRIVFFTPYALPRGGKRTRDNDRSSARVDLVDGEAILSAAAQKAPDVLAHLGRRARYFLNADKDLDRVKESRIALDLTNELSLDKIYVAMDIRHSNDAITRLAQRALWSVGGKLVQADADDLAVLRRIGDLVHQHPHVRAPDAEDPAARDLVNRLGYSRVSEEGVHRTTQSLAYVDIDALLSALQAQIRLAFDAVTDELRAPGTLSASVREVIRIRKVWRRLRAVPLFQREWERDAFAESANPRGRCALSQPWRPSGRPLGVLDLLEIEAPIQILGPAGTGKTTLLRRLGQTLARDRGGLVPVFVRLAFVEATSRDAVVDACTKALVALGFFGQATASVETGAFVREMKAGGFVLLFDGLDEAGSRAAELLHVLESLATDFPRARLLVTSRETAPRFRDAFIVRVLPFRDEQLDAFIANWFTSQPSKRETLLAAIRANKDLHESARIPLIAALLCSLHDLGEALPSTGFALYERRFELLLGKWDLAKELPALLPAERRRYLRFLVDLAYDMHVRQKRSISLDDVYEQAFEFTKGRALARELIDDCIERNVLEVELSRVSFGHLTNQEFLASKRLLEENNTEFLLTAAEQSWWHGALRFYASQRRDIAGLIVAADERDLSSEVVALIIELAEMTEVPEEGNLSSLKESIGMRRSIDSEGDSEPSAGELDYIEDSGLSKPGGYLDDVAAEERADEVAARIMDNPRRLPHPQ